MKNWTVPFISIVVFAALLGYVMWGGPAGEQTPEPVDTVDLGMVDVEAEDILEVSLLWDDAPEVVIRADDSGDDRYYLLLAPYDHPADQDRARLLFSSIPHLKGTRLVAEEDPDLTEFGLDDPIGVFTARTIDGSELVVHVGDASPLGRGDDPDRYARVVGEDRVYLMAGIRIAFFNAPTEKWRDPVMLRLDGIQEIRVTTGSQEWSAVRVDGPYEWELVSPMSSPALKRVAEEVIRSLNGIRTEEYVVDFPGEEDLAEYGLDEPSMRIEFVSEDGTSQKLLVGRYADEGGTAAYAHTTDASFIGVLKVGAYSLPGLASPYNWPAYRVFSPVQTHRVTGVQWDWKGESYLLTRGEDHWTLEPAEGADREVENSDAERVVRSLISIEAVDVQVLEESGLEHGLDSPRGRVTVTFSMEDDTAAITLHVGHTGETSYAMVDGYHDVFLVFPTDLAGILGELAALP